MIKNYFIKLSSFFIIFLFLTSITTAKTFYSIASGKWSDKSSWSEIWWNQSEASTIPSGNDTIKIGSGKTIILDRNVDLFDGGILIIDYGRLEFSSGSISADFSQGSYVQVGEFGALLNAGKKTGWVKGELRLFVGDGTEKRDLIFDIGDNTNYSPFGISFSTGLNSVSGYLSSMIVTGFHPEVKTPISVDIVHVVGPKFWRLMQPEGSAFVRGDRNLDISLAMNENTDLGYVDSWKCSEIGFLRSWTNNFDWQALWPDTTGSLQFGMSCEDTRALIRPVPNFAYFGSYDYENSLVTLGVPNIPILIPLGSIEKIGNNILLGDFIAGDENQIVASVEDINQGNSLHYSYTSNGIITFVINNEQINSISIYNTFGDELSIDKSIIKISKSSLSLDVNSLPNGVYFLKTDNTITKFIVIR